MKAARILLVALTLTAGFGMAGRQTVFRSVVNYVEVDVSVTSNNRPVAGLRAADFELRDNGVQQKILVMARETHPVDVTLVIDASGSVQGFLLVSLVNAVNRIRESLHSGDRATLLTFNQRILERAGLTPVSSLGQVRAGVAAGTTSLYDAIAVAMAAPPPENRRQMAIVFTDGLDTISFLDEASVLEVARHSRIAVFIVATADGRNVPHQSFFRKLVESTGGLVQEVKTYTSRTSTRYGMRPPQNNNFLDASFARALEDFRTSYVLRYTLEGVPSPGWHDLAVRVVKPGSRYEVRARRGYVGQ